MESAFSIEELGQLALIFPPTTSEDGLRGHKITTLKEDEGFVHLGYLEESVKDVLLSYSHRSSTAEIAHDLSVSSADVEVALAKFDRHFARSVSGSQLVPSQLLESVVAEISEICSAAFQDLALLSKRLDVNARDLKRCLEAAPDLDAFTCSSDRGSTSKTYYASSRLANETNSDIEAILKRVKEPLCFQSDTLHGLDPSSFVRLAEAVADKIDSSHKFVLVGGNVYVVPEEWRQSQKHLIFSKLAESGWIDAAVACSQNKFAFTSTDQMVSEMRAHFTDQQVNTVDTMIILGSFLEEQTSSWIGDLSTSGYVFKGLEGQRYPAEVMGLLIDRLNKSLKQIDRTLTPLSFDPYLVSSKLITRMRSVWEEIVTSVASDDWQAYLRTIAEKKYPSPPMDIAERVSTGAETRINALVTVNAAGMARPPIELVQAVYKQEFTRSKAEQKYRNAVRHFDTEDAKRFYQAWKVEVVGRVKLWALGIANMKDPKLQADLATLLVEHVCTEFVKVKTKALRPASRSTLAALGNLEANMVEVRQSTEPLKAVKDIANHVMLDAGEYERPDEMQLDLDAIKREEVLALRKEFVGNAQLLDTDGGRILLAVLIVLLAKQQPGLIYATGRFVPRLLKQLKGHVEAERFERLLRLKEEAKAGRIGDDGRRELLQMLEE